MECWYLAFAILLLTAGIPRGDTAMSKSGLRQMQGMMKNVCKKKSGVEQEVLNKVKEGNLEENAKFKCYLKCCLGMMQTMKNDKIDVESATKQIKSLLPNDMKEKSLKQLNACKDSVGSDPCDLAYQFIVCSYNVDKDNMLIPL